MKKLYLFMLILIISLVSVQSVQAEPAEQIPLINHIDNHSVIHFYNGETVYVPKELRYAKQQFRGIYIYTKDNLNFNQQNTIEDYKQEFMTILNQMEVLNMNAIMFEVRPLNDAFYQSNLNPWSRFLTGEENKNPGWDPLKWMIRETHKRQIDFYAGINLFQVSEKTDLSINAYLRELSDKNYAKNHKDFLLSVRDENNQYEYFLNPGIKEVQQFLIDSVMELINNYDVDAVNIENYFYPYDPFNTIDDIETFIQNGDVEMMLQDWRRGNINQLLNQIKNQIHYYNEKNGESVQLGVTPFGVWKHRSQSDNGSYTRGKTAYNDQNADTLSWVKNDYIDYIIPQISRSFEDSQVPYADIVKWWARQVEETNVNLYIGQSMKEEWNSQNQVIDQLKFNQNYSSIHGTLFMNYNQIKAPNEVNSELLQTLSDYWRYPAFIPSLHNEEQNIPDAVSRLLGRYADNQMNFSWETVPEAKYYVVYRFENEDIINLDDPSHIIKVMNSSNNNRLTFIDRDIKSNNIYYYFIVVLDKSYIESQPVTFGIDLHPNEMFKTEVTILIVSSIITLGVLGFTANKALKNS